MPQASSLGFGTHTAGASHAAQEEGFIPVVGIALNLGSIHLWLRLT